MLGTRTKQVFSYGRRGHRIVNVNDDHTKVVSRAENLAAKLSPDSSSEMSDSDTPHQPIKSLKPESKAICSPLVSPGSVIKTKRKRMPASKANHGPRLSKPALIVSPTRKPLSAVSANVISVRSTDSSSASTMARKKAKSILIGRGTPPRLKSLKPVSPIVNVDITILDDHGKPIKQERRVSRSDVQMNTKLQRPKPSCHVSQTYRRSGMSKQDAITLSDDDDDDEYVPPRPVPAKVPNPSQTRQSGRAVRPHARAIVLSSDEESEVEVLDVPHNVPQPIPPPHVPSTQRRSPPRQRTSIARPSLGSSQLISKPPAATQKKVLPISRKRDTVTPRPYKNAIHFSPLVHQKAQRDSRPLTPYRSKICYATISFPPSPSLSSNADEDLSFNFAQLALSPASLDQLNADYTSLALDPEKAPPAYLKPLLDACSQPTPHEFSAFIEMFPHDHIVQTSHGGVGLKPMGGSKSSAKGKAYFQKIGEASFSEVFGIGDVVLKVIPLRDEESSKIVADDADVPAPSDAKDVLREIIVTRAMGEMCEGFVQLLRTYVVRGKYPSVLLDLWDEYDERKGSEGVRPHNFGVSQLYAIIVLPNGGPDLETFAFSPGKKYAWTQACSLFWQVTRMLAEAEDLVHFEHRDLHWGQILVKSIAETQVPRLARGRRIPMDHDVHGVRATVIDLGLSRMESGEADGVHFTVPDEEVFEGEGDYQFEIYRMMRSHNSDAWRTYRPLTNVMWLHYLVLKLLHSKGLRKPMLPRKPPVAPSPTFTERECYQCLADIEAVLCNAVTSCKPVQKKGRRKTQAVPAAPAVDGPLSAGDLLEIGVSKGWVD